MEDFESQVLQRLTSIETKIGNGITSTQKDHERRIRFLEKGFYIALGGLALLQIMIKVFIK